MYIRGGQGYYARDGSQHARRGQFLILLTEDDFIEKRQLYAITRQVALSQVGHWMMGTARMYGHSVTMSGAYGSDGLTISVSRLPEPIRDRVRAEMAPLPDWLYRLWADGGGWNSAGSEADKMRKWARETFPSRRRK